MTHTQDYEHFAIISLILENYENKMETLDEVIIDTGYDDQLLVNRDTFDRLNLDRWRSPRGEEIMRKDSTVIYGRGKINIPGLISGYWEIDVATYPYDRELREVNLLGLGVLDKMCAAFNSLARPKQLILKVISCE